MQIKITYCGFCTVKWVSSIYNGLKCIILIPTLSTFFCFVLQIHSCVGEYLKAYVICIIDALIADIYS